MSKPKMQKRNATPLRIGDFAIIVVGERCWGRGTTLREAVDNCARENAKSRRRHIVYLVHPSASIDEAGDFVQAAGTFVDYPPREIHRVGC